MNHWWKNREQNHQFACLMFSNKMISKVHHLLVSLEKVSLKSPVFFPDRSICLLKHGKCTNAAFLLPAVNRGLNQCSPIDWQDKNKPSGVHPTCQSVDKLFDREGSSNSFRQQLFVSSMAGRWNKFWNEWEIWPRDERRFWMLFFCCCRSLCSRSVGFRFKNDCLWLHAARVWLKGAAGVTFYLPNH